MSHFIVLGKFLYFPLFSFAFLRLSSRPRGCSGAGFIVRPWGGGEGRLRRFFSSTFHVSFNFMVSFLVEAK